MANRPITDFAQNILKPYINNQDKAYAANIAPVETSPATSAHTAGKQIIYNGVLYDVTADIAANDALATTGAGANIAAADDVSEQISNVKQALSNEVSARATLGAHNLLVTTDDGFRRYNTAGTWSGDAYALNGVTFTLNKDENGRIVSIKVNGTASANTFFIYPPFGTMNLESGNYKINGNSSNYSSNTARLQVVNANNGGIADIGTDYSLSYDSTSAWKDYRLSIRVDSGKAPSDMLFTPMLRLAVDTDTTYRPYVPTNAQLLSYKDNGVLGAKNFWNNTGYISISNVSIANNGFTNTATDSRTQFYFRLWALNSSGSNIGSSPIAGEEINSTGTKSYTVTLPSGTKQLRIIHNGASTIMSIAVPFSVEVGTYKLVFDVNGYNPSTVGGLDIRNIMLLVPSDTDPTYQPYAKTNQALTKDDSGLTENAFENGCVNLLNITTQSSTITSNSANLTVLVDNGIITLNGTTGTQRININLKSNPFKNGKTYKLSGCPSGGAENSYGMHNGSFGQGIVDYGNGVTFTYDSSKGNSLYISLAAGQTLTNKVFKPMLTLADVPNSDYNHYVPYAKSNKELTDATADVNSWFTKNTTVMTTNNFRAQRIGNLCILAMTGYGAVDSIPVNTDVPVATLNNTSLGIIYKNATGCEDSAARRPLNVSISNNTISIKNLTGTAARYFDLLIIFYIP